MSDDRTVHAACATFEVVRYNRAGKWYVETTNGGRREHLSLRDAAQRALAAETLGGSVYPRLPGGSTFDVQIRVLRARFGQPEPTS